MARNDSIMNQESGTSDGRKVNKSHWGILLVVIIPLFLVVLNDSAVVVLLPELGRDLSIGTGRLAWLMTAFLLVHGVAIPFYGRIADLHGARRLYLFGLIVFVIGSVLSAFAPSYSLLLGARIVQGIGAAAIPGLGMAIASRAFPDEKRGTVLGLISAIIGVSLALGPPLGGIMSDAFGWRSVFIISAVSVLVIPVGWKILPRDEEQGDEPLDVLGGILLALLISGSLFAAGEGVTSGWGSWQVLSSAGVSVAALIALAIRQKTTLFPFLPKELIQNRRYVLLVFMAFTVAAVDLAVLVGLPLLLTSAHGLTVAQVGYVLLPGAVMTAVVGVVAGRLVDRIGARIPVWIGAAMMLVAMLGLSSYAGSEVWLIGLFMAILGTGFALVNTPIAAVVSLAVRTQVLAMALSINTMLLFIGGSFGIALLTVIVVTRQGLTSALNPLHIGHSGLTVAQVGYVLLPGAVMTAVVGVVAGRLVDRIGARIPVWIGAAMMLVAMLGLSSYAGSEVWLIGLFMAILGTGFALVNTPIAAVVSLAVRTQVLAMALSINTMLLFIGGSFGIALLTVIVITRQGLTSALNPLHIGQGVEFSDAFLILAIPVIALMALSLAIPRKVSQPVQPEPQVASNWVPNCSIPWAPECEEAPKTPSPMKSELLESQT